MFAPNTNEMRSIIIHVDKDESVLEKLTGMNDWKLEPLGITGGHEYCLTNGSEKVALRLDADNVAMTSNVLPHDWDHDQVSANKTLKELSKSLTDAGIQNSITASEVDLA